MAKYDSFKFISKQYYEWRSEMDLQIQLAFTPKIKLKYICDVKIITLSGMKGASNYAKRNGLICNGLIYVSY